MDQPLPLILLLQLGIHLVGSKFYKLCTLEDIISLTARVDIAKEMTETLSQIHRSGQLEEGREIDVAHDTRL